MSGMKPVCCGIVMVLAAQIATMPALAAPALAAKAPAQALPASAAITLPFNPPVGTPLRYAYERRVEARGQVQLMRSIEELSFRRRADGWQLQWVTKSVDFEVPGPMQPILAALARANVGVTLLLSLDTAGVLQGIDNLDAVRAASNQALTAMLSEMDTQFAAIPADQRLQFRQVMNGLADQQRRQTDEQFGQGLLQSVAMLLHEGEALVPDQPKQESAELVAPFGNGTLRYDLRTVLEDWRPGIAARLVTTSVADPDDVRRFSQDMVKQMLASIPDAKNRASAEAAIAAMPTLRIEDETVQDIALPTGIVERAQYSRMVDIPGQGSRSETRKFTLVK